MYSQKHQIGKVGHKSHDLCFNKKYIEAGFITFVTSCTIKNCVLLVFKMVINSLNKGGKSLAKDFYMRDYSG